MAIVVGQDGYRASKGPGKMNGLKAIKQTALSQRESKAHPKQHNRRNVRQLHGSLRNWMPNICCSSRLRRYNLHWPRQIQLTDESDTCRNQDVDAILMPQSLAIKTPAKTTTTPVLHMKSPLRPELGTHSLQPTKNIRYRSI